MSNWHAIKKITFWLFIFLHMLQYVMLLLSAHCTVPTQVQVRYYVSCVQWHSMRWQPVIAQLKKSPLFYLFFFLLLFKGDSCQTCRINLNHVQKKRGMNNVFQTTVEPYRVLVVLFTIFQLQYLLYTNISVNKFSSFQKMV